MYYNPLLVKTINPNSVRITEPSGIRFCGFIETQTKLVADECGFIIARGDQITNANEEVRFTGKITDSTSETFTATNKDGLKMIGARSYVKNTETDKLEQAFDGKTPFGSYEKDGFYFTGVVIKLDGSYTNAKNNTKYAHRYNAPLVARAYVKIGSSYLYGECVETSLLDVISYLKDNEEETYNKNKNYFDGIIDNSVALVEE